MTDTTLGKLVELSREELVSICERAIVPQSEWENRDSPEAQQQVGQCWALLRAGCPFSVNQDDKMGTYWVTITHPVHDTFEHDPELREESTFYLPQPERIEDGVDWY